MNDRDPDFATKAVAVIELLLNPPTDGPLFCVDEKPGIGVRQPTAPDQPPVPRRPPARALGQRGASSSTNATAPWTCWQGSA